MKFEHFFVVAITLQLSVCDPVPYYKKLSPEEAQRLASWKPNDKQPMWELSGQYQGDIVLTPGQRNGAIDTSLRWSNRELPYEISSDFTEQEKQFIRQSLEEEYGKTCIKVRPRTANDRDYVYVINHELGCWSPAGRLGGSQELNLQTPGCMNRGTIAHEFLHALGFYHQQSATERDDYVDILWENIVPDAKYAFDKLGPENITSFGQKYDYDSVMHYGKYAFSFNGLPTILPKDPNANIGQRDGLSAIDIIKLNKMYNCA